MRGAPRFVIARTAATTAALLATATSIALAQAPRATVVVTAKDSTGAPVSGAELTLTRGLKDILAHATTDSDGHGVLSLEVKDSSDAEVTMRKIGYARGDHFFSVGPRDTAHVTITVAHNSNTLAPVEITAKKKDQRWTSYHVDADEIEASNE
ncbi:MAG TPA: carboxypeptidase-like regulatory domain-containing protein, partial [Gemmatimonadaceae bacterium]